MLCLSEEKFFVPHKLKIMKTRSLSDNSFLVFCLLNENFTENLLIIHLECEFFSCDGRCLLIEVIGSILKVSCESEILKFRFSGQENL